MRRLLPATLLIFAFSCSSDPTNESGDDMAGAPPGASPDMAGAPAGASPDMAASDPSGPWPTADLTLYGAAEGLGGGLIDANVDGGQNIWAASSEVLYLLRPGEDQFHSFTAADGLHIQPFVDAFGNPSETALTAIAGGRAGEVYVGYYGYESASDPFLDSLEKKQLGNADRVVVGSDGKLTIRRYEFRCDYAAGAGCWEDRSVRRMLYSHQGIAADHLFIGFNHGVTHVYQDVFGDHVHPDVVWHRDGMAIQALGEFFGLALTPEGDLWMAGRYGVGLQTWNPQPHGNGNGWVDGRFKAAFTTYTTDHSLDVPWGYKEYNVGAGVTSDGTVWLASDGNGLTSYKDGRFQHWSQVPSSLSDLQADADDTLWIVSGGQLLRFNPKDGTLRTFAGLSGVRRVSIDATVAPRALYAATANGLAVIRAP
jgi:hypothetical protein